MFSDKAFLLIFGLVKNDKLVIAGKIQNHAGPFVEHIQIQAGGRKQANLGFKLLFLGAVLGGNGSGIGDFLAQIHIFEQAALAVDGVKAEIEKKQDAENQKTGVFNFIRQI